MTPQVGFRAALWGVGGHLLSSFCVLKIKFQERPPGACKMQENLSVADISG